MNKFILVTIVGLFSNLQACPNTEKVKIFLEYKIDRVLESEENLSIMSAQLDVLLECHEFVVYLEYLDSREPWDR